MKSDAPLDVVAAAHAAHLRYMTDAAPGIRRLRHGKSFRYQNPDKSAVKDADTLARIRSLVIPPAWNEVWIAPAANAHLQATGRDARGRKQSRYHPRWRATRDETKYERMKEFAAVLPAIRERVNHDLALPGMPREKVLAAILRIMETTYIRVGNEEYARQNQSYGLTTLRNRHVEVHGGEVKFHFRGKSGVEHAISLADRRIARIVKQCHDLPGYELFQFLDHEGNHHRIESADVNEYLREITSEHFTAKDFRTWAGSVLTCMILQECEPPATKKTLVQTIAQVASKLGNTPTVCRKCYIHPAVLEHYLSGSFGAQAQRLARRVAKSSEAGPHALRQEELILLSLLKRKLTKAA
jgi:DNA topoisomerase-1